MDLQAVAISVILLVVGAGVAFVPTYLNERRKERHALEVRWDVPLYELCKEFSATSRQFLHLARRYGRSKDKEAHQRLTDEQHARLRAVSQQLCILGSEELQRAARLVVHHAYWVREVEEGREDKRAADYNNVSPEDRLRTAMQEFFVAARLQLGVKQPENVAPDEVLAGEPTRETRSAVSEEQSRLP